MAESLFLPETRERQAVYEAIYPQIKALIDAESDLIANLANVSAVLREAFGFFWVGFYLVKDEELVLGPFQGPLACTRIRKGKGVCGQAWAQAQSILVPDVDAFPGHIACSSASRSEVVIPIVKDGVVLGVLDVDSDQLDDFTAVDVQELERLMAVVAEKF
ncbi:GAF domain-containing protein [Nitritalea halalkaliphila LW7]|uniref:GAF domain-containing protein n=1 Tax=Nitritalea halalkaliphila LW7 TaxID=1189621 RepID=I5C5E2_9BACT|nr:GAF domain-containing protein [Nitritalea halalkaliphila]EIM77044.1 GAF domain-containing protein [Nitritalea halalkaliphila LW7]